MKHAVHFVLEGFNGTIMAYGQTSSGKTHTLFGDVNDPQHRGIVPRAAAALASCMAAHRGDCTFRMAISVLEVHNEKIRDLLVPSQDNLQVFKDDTHGVEVPGLHSELLDIEDTEAACLKFVTTAMSNRAVAATAMNEASSRSHCMVILGVTRTFHDGRTQYSKLCLVVSSFDSIILILSIGSWLDYLSTHMFVYRKERLDILHRLIVIIYVCRTWQEVSAKNALGLMGPLS